MFSMQRAVALAAASLFCAGAFATGSLPASPARTDSYVVPTVVLVHGDFADGSGWSPVIKLLQAAGVNAVAVQNPLSSLEADVAATKLVIDNQPGPVVLVGHSWGGFVITAAGDDPKVQSLVYVAGFAPAGAETALSLTSAAGAPPWLDTLTLYGPNQDGFTLDESDYLAYFAPDVPVQTAKALYATQGVGSTNALGETTTTFAWQLKPSRFVLATQDQMIAPATQVMMSERMNAKVTTVNSSHVVMISHPDVVARVILDAVLHP